jgi:hypothetical protein
MLNGTTNARIGRHFNKTVTGQLVLRDISVSGILILLVLLSNTHFSKSKYARCVQYLFSGVHHVRLNVGCGGNKYPFYDLRCEVNSDVQKPKTTISNFVLSDVCCLPFRDKAFEKVYAFNVLEHVRDHDKAVKELDRISEEVVIRFDRVYNLANWFTADHENLVVENLVAFPAPIKLIVRLARFPIDNNEGFRNMLHKTFPALRKAGLLDKWNYYQIK